MLIFHSEIHIYVNFIISETSTKGFIQPMIKAERSAISFVLGNNNVVGPLRNMNLDGLSKHHYLSGFLIIIVNKGNSFDFVPR